VKMTYMTDTGQVEGPEFSMGAGRRKSINVANSVPDTWEVSTKVESTEPIVAERAMYWNGRSGGNESIGVPAPADDWYLAEGSTGGGFETWILIQNPGDEAANVKMTYMTDTGQVEGPEFSMGAGRRKSINVANSVPDTWEVSTKVESTEPVVAERAMYWNGRSGGHESIGVPAPADDWYLAEGSTSGGFETWILIQNPGDEAANVKMTYMTDTGQVEGPEFSMGAGRRKSINVADSVPDTWEVSTKVESTEPIVAERAMYWNGRTDGHHSVGFGR
ncbi:MAG: hypothetical protein MUO75_00430, partial [Actinobacteria bacterium]|nr:hypothetical protein [Actinomycetota bacterium]